MQMMGWDRSRGSGARNMQSTAARRPRAMLAMLVAMALVVAASIAAVTAGADAPVASFVPQGGKLIAAGESGAGRFGRSVALSADGMTAIVGAPHNRSYKGAVWVFTRSGSEWHRQAVLSVSAGQTSTYFGRGVALSADGSVAIVGDPGVENNNGDAWVFARVGGTWLAIARLTGAESGAGAQFGRSVALSADGHTALVGAFSDEGRVGSAYAFRESGGTWRQIGRRITPSDEQGEGFFGRSVALSASGTAALIGGSEDSKHRGAAWFFELGGEGFEQIGHKLTGGEEESGIGEFGSGVALSADGSTAVVGAPGDNNRAGAAWVFQRNGTTWHEQGHKLTGSGAEPPSSTGYNVAISGDGRIVIASGLNDAGGVGAAWVFGRSSGAWSQQGAKLTGAEEVGAGEFGYGLALSTDGSTAMIGGLADSSLAGAVWPFTNTLAHGGETEEGGGEKGGGEKGGGKGGEKGGEKGTGTGTGITATPIPLTPKSGVLGTVTSSPVLGSTGNIEPAGGEVWVVLPGSKARVLLSSLRQVPFGTLIDARKGRVVVVVALPGGGTERGEFFGGEFVLSQGRNGVVVAKLAGGTYTNCPTAKQRAHKAAVSAGRRVSGRHQVRHLWANAHGTFSTRGSYAAGAVQGTEWLTEDRCEGTFIKVTRDKVKVTDLLRHRSVTVYQGHSILVRVR